MIATTQAPLAATIDVLSVEHLTKRYTRGATPAVSDVNIAVESGEIMAVVGESGCGKTTLLRLIAGLETPDSGTIRIENREVAGPSGWVAPERRGVGMVFQDFALFPHMTSAENVAFGLLGRSRSEKADRARAMLDVVGLSGLGERYPHQLSGGQQQRVALARALAPQPALLLLDEPFSNLDTALKRSLRDEVRDILRRTGTTAILVVHDAEDVLLVADRAAVMRNGRILQMGDPHTIYRRPNDEYIARFFGETNVLAGRACAGGFETPLGVLDCPGAQLGRGAVRLCLRPEDLVFVSNDGAGRPAIVRSVRAAGRLRRVVVSLENGTHGGEHTLTIDTGPDVRLAEGDRVFVGSRPGCAHIIAGE